MSLTFAYDTYYLIFLHVFSIFVLLFVNFSIWMKAKKIPLLYAYLAVQGILLLWMTAKIFKTVAPDSELKFFFVVCQYLGVCFLGEVFLIFAYLYAMGKLPAVPYIILMAVPPLVFLLVLITNPYHLLFYSHFDFWGDRFGPVFYVHQAYNYILILAGMLLCAKNFRRQFGEERVRAFLFSIAILVPIIANMLYVFDGFEAVFGFQPPCDITPISCNISLMMFALATFKFRLFDDIRIARRDALALIPDGILLLDNRYRIADFNETFKNMYENGGLHDKTGKGVICRLPVNAPIALYERAAFIPEDIQPCDRTYEAENGCCYRVVCQHITANDRFCGISLRFVDLTLKQAILFKMESRNSELSAFSEKLKEQAHIIKNLVISRTRNYIAGEVHDALGHSVVLVISLLEVARISLGKPGFDLSSCISRARAILQDCLKRSSILGQPDMAAAKDCLADRLNRLMEEIKPASVEVELTVPRHIPHLPQEYESTIFNLCRESITNAIRHGKADKINIILRLLSRDLEVYVIDNGAGCGEIKKGMGITGMEKRLAALGGCRLQYGSMGGHGFFLQALIPIKSDCS